MNLKTNFEEYKDTLYTLAQMGTVAIVNNKPQTCNGACNKCDLHMAVEFGVDADNCQSYLLDWLLIPYELKMTQEEIGFLRVMKTGYISIDADGESMWTLNKPYAYMAEEGTDSYVSDETGEIVFGEYPSFDKLNFNGIEHSTCVSVEELLKYTYSSSFIKKDEELEQPEF